VSSSTPRRVPGSTALGSPGRASLGASRRSPLQRCSVAQANGHRRWLLPAVADLGYLPRGVQLRGDLPVPEDRGPGGWALDLRCVLGIALLADRGGRGRRGGRCGDAPCSPLGTTTTNRARRGASPSTSTSVGMSVNARHSRASSLGAWAARRSCSSRGSGSRAPCSACATWRSRWTTRRAAAGFAPGGQVTVRVREPVVPQETVTCGIPGHHRSGREVVTELLSVEDGPLEFELSGRCGYETTFEYSSESA
jgi:hypothetical protein